jgi:hypothetical protein
LLTFSSPSRSPPSPSPSSSSSSLGFGTMRLKGKKNGKFHFLRIIMTDRITFGSHLFLKKLVFPIFLDVFQLFFDKRLRQQTQKVSKEKLCIYGIRNFTKNELIFKKINLHFGKVFLDFFFIKYFNLQN